MARRIAPWAAAVGTAGALSAPAAGQNWTWIDSRDPMGVPDITQGNAGICAAACTANLMWNWGAFAPYNGNPPLVSHTNPNNWTQSWRADADALRDRLEHFIYRDGVIFKNGYGVPGGITKWLKERGHAYSWWTNQNGLSTVEYAGANATYARLMGFITGPAPTPHVYTGWIWYDAAGTPLNGNGGQKAKHALGSAGYDQNNFHAFTNGWGDHNFPNGPVVRTGYYDQYAIAVNGGRLRITWADNMNRAGAPGGVTWGSYFVRTFDNTASYAQMYRFILIKQGGSPRVRLNRVDPVGGRRNRYFIEVWNAHPEPLYDVFVEVKGVGPGLSVNDLVASARQPPGWVADQWRPDAGERFRDRFGFDSLERDGDQLLWAPDWTGLWWTTSTAPIAPNERVLFSYDAPDWMAYRLDDDALAVTAELNLATLYFAGVGGPAGCYPDCDQSTGPEVLDIFDFLCFQNRFDAGDPYACDCDESTGQRVCDIFDFLCFQNAFAAGCR